MGHGGRLGGPHDERRVVPGVATEEGLRSPARAAPPRRRAGPSRPGVSSTASVVPLGGDGCGQGHPYRVPGTAVRRYLAGRPGGPAGRPDGRFSAACPSPLPLPLRGRGGGRFPAGRVEPWRRAARRPSSRCRPAAVPAASAERPLGGAGRSLGGRGRPRADDARSVRAWTSPSAAAAAAGTGHRRGHGRGEGRATVAPGLEALADGDVAGLALLHERQQRRGDEDRGVGTAGQPDDQGQAEALQGGGAQDEASRSRAPTAPG